MISYIIQNFPCLFFILERCVNLNMCNTATAALLIEDGAEAALLLNGALLHEGDPLIAVNKVFVLLKQQVIRLTDNACAVLSGDRLDIE